MICTLLGYFRHCPRNRSEVETLPVVEYAWLEVDAWVQFYCLVLYWVKASSDGRSPVSVHSLCKCWSLASEAIVNDCLMCASCYLYISSSGDAPYCCHLIVLSHQPAETCDCEFVMYSDVTGTCS